MSKGNFCGENLYITDEYIKKHPSLHEEDSPWKVSKIIPLIDKLSNYFEKDEINLLDVGGGAGLIIKAISTYVEQSYGIKVNKFSLDLSPGMLEIQRKRNPDLKKALNEDIRKTSLSAKETDVTLVIDLLEHVPNPIEALEELKRISKFVILKVPLEDTVLLKLWNFIMCGKPRQKMVRNMGHINIYNFTKLRYQTENHMGQVLDYYFTNVFEYSVKSEHYKTKMNVLNKLTNFAGAFLFRLSPRLCSFILNDFVMILVKCY